MSVVGKMVCAAVVLALCASQGRSGSTQGSVQPASIAMSAPPQKVKNLVFVEAPEIHLGEATKRFPQGSRLVRISLDELAKTNGPPIPLTTGLFAAADPQVSSDGQNLLFSGQMKHGGNWQIFTIPSGGGLARQLTHSAADCLHPLYLPDDFIAYTATQGSGSARSSQVEVSRSDGSQAQPITFGPGEFDVQTVLRSGRILLSANSPLTPSNGQRRMRAFYVMDPDGSGLTLLRQDDATSATSSDAEEGSDGTIIFVQQPSGKLERIRPGSLQAETIAGAPSGYASVHAWSDAELLVSRRTKGGQFDLYRIAPDQSSPAQLVYRGSNTSSVDAVVVTPHPAAEMYRSILHPERTSGRMICLDAYASNDLPNGRLSGHIVRVRVLAKEQRSERVLGEAPVEADGSFYATVPADLPIRLMLLGPKGEVLKQQRSWIWIRKGEDRGCVGCHESQAQAPENRSPLTLLRMDTPTLLTVTAPITSSRKAVRP